MSVSTDIFNMLEAKRAKEGAREYLGGSIVGYGQTCERQLWYRWQGVDDGDGFDGRMLRLLDHGQSEEERLVRDLKAAGYEVVGQQMAAWLFEGRFRLHIDGLIRRDKGQWRVLEIKTSNKRRFAEIAKDGIERVHRAQVQIAMHLLGLREALYIVVCKDTDELHEHVEVYDPATGEALVAMIERVLSADSAPDRPVTFPDKWGVCKWCPAFDTCWAAGEINFKW
jgi:CRISPR/Cas system-associated exonuclease Cas4 (RecB family)